jgi:hypothetical protein
MLPRIVRFGVRVFMKRKILSEPMRAGFKLPKSASGLIPPPTSLEEGLQAIRQAIQRLKTESKRGPNSVLGRLSIEEWNQLHCHHAELHHSFLILVN